MARSITSCTGEVFTIGDRIKTPSGKIITMQGGAIGATFYNAEKCTKAHAHEVSAPEPAAMAASDSDCIVWGS